MDWDVLSKDLSKQNWIILLILAAGSFLLMKPTFTLGIILGGLIIIANFNLLQHTIRCSFSSGGVMRTNKLSIIAKYYFRLAALGLIIYTVITHGWVNPIGLAIGLSTIVFSIIQLAIRTLLKTSSGEAV